MSVEKEYTDVLQNIELGIVSVYEDDPMLLDLDVLDALDGLIRLYAREEQGRHLGRLNLSDRAHQVFEAARHMCEWRLGRTALSPEETEHEDREPAPISVAEILLCLKRIHLSVRRWHGQGGRQGYLKYVHQFLSHAAGDADS